MFSGSIDAIDVDILAIINEDLSPTSRSKFLADVAREELAAAENANQQAIGFVPGHTTLVDGVDASSEDKVRPDGTIVYSFDLLPNVFGWISEQLQAFAPVLSGRFAQSFQFFVDGGLSDIYSELHAGSEFVFLSGVPYAGKIEGEDGTPESQQAPHGVFEAVATLAQMKFPQVRIEFSYRTPFPDAHSTSQFTPAITITLEK